MRTSFAISVAPPFMQPPRPFDDHRLDTSALLLFALPLGGTLFLCRPIRTHPANRMQRRAFA